MKKLISVVICTHNRADLLAGALASLREQTLDAARYEVIVVDNDSTDSTAAVTQDFCLRFPNVRYSLETQLGLSHARNRGRHEARGEYVGYMDDDCKAPPEWLEIAGEVIEQKAPAIFGGPNYPFYNSPKPRWYKDVYATHDLGPEARSLHSSEYIYGMNIFFRRTLLEALGGFDPELGMSGKKIAYGEETAPQVRVRAEMPGEIIYYEPRLHVYHLVPARKMTWGWMLRAAWAGGRYSCRMLGEKRSRYKRFRALLLATRQVALLVGTMLRGTLLRDRRIHPYFSNYAYERVMPCLVALGALYERMHP
jgi:glucosyl-dolichyl phosphate glucuronosyltransferase